MPNGTPFSRVHALMLQVAAALALPAGARQVALEQIGPYVSRGKGQGGRYLGTSRISVAGAKRAAIKARNRARNKAAHRG